MASKTTAHKPSRRGKPVSSSKKKTAGRVRSTPRRRKFASYQAAIKRLNDRVDLERARVIRLRRDAIKLERMSALMTKLGDPQDTIKTVHIAGTKGKGSVCAMLASTLRECGYTVGVFTSPHLIDVRERIVINGKLIPTAAFSSLIARCDDAAGKIEKEHGQPSFFEMIAAMALCWFAEQAVDIAIIETGLGGRLDATNVIKPEVTAVAAISLDHTQILGDSSEEIAREKAGIFKPDTPALTFKQPQPILEAMREVADRAGAQFEIVGVDIEFSHRFEVTPKIGPHTCVCLSTDRSSFEHVNVPLAGEHQAFNCGLALAVLDKLRERGFDTPESKVIAGLEKTALAGRMELASNHPRIVLDGAHNSDSLRALMRSIGIHMPYDSLVLVFGCGEDKDVDELLRRISMGADKIIFTRAKGNARAVDPYELQRRFAEINGKMTQVAPTLPEALDLARRAVGRGDLICVTGSFFLVGEAKKQLAAQVAKLESARAAAAV